MVIFFLGGVVFNVYQGSLEKRRLKQEIDQLEEEIARASIEKKRLKEQIEHVNSKDFIEEVARRKLGLVKKGEMLYVITDDRGTGGD
nr:septum formation initiator family protein [Natroniella acetigena]